MEDVDDAASLAQPAGPTGSDEIELDGKVSVAKECSVEGIYIEPKPSLWARLKLSNLIKRKELWRCYGD